MQKKLHTIKKFTVSKFYFINVVIKYSRNKLNLKVQCRRSKAYTNNFTCFIVV